jgi:uncharacterized tellurite resistance protein B-like protein
LIPHRFQLIPEDQMGATSEIQETIRAELAEFREQAGYMAFEQIAGGDWFEACLTSSLGKYREMADADYFQGLYPGQSRLEIATDRIELAKRSAALEGRMTAGAYTGTVASAFGGRGTVPDGDVTSDASLFVADLLWTTRLQLRLAHDLCVIHGRTIELGNPEDLHDLVRIAFGVKSGEILELAVRETLVDARDVGIKSDVSGVDDAVRRKLPLIGKHLLRRSVVKYALPVVSVPLNAALNYLFTVQVAHMASEILVETISEPEALRDASQLGSVSPRVLLETIWLIIVADEKITEGESKFINNLITKLSELEGGEETLNVLRNLQGIDEETVLADVARESDEVKQALYEVVCDAAAIDHKIHRKERKVIERFAKVCGVTYDLRDLKKRAKL